VFEGIVESPDVDTILADHPKALANQGWFVLPVAIQDRGERALRSTSDETTHAFRQGVQE
jgi:hypothetical protein